ncbi:MAG: TylF/MycF/NovP-related O-methyltransferase [Cyanobacteria bacterium P01_F01_bin.42]
MFYGNFTPESRQDFQKFIKLLPSIFGRVFAQDNLITLQRSAGFLNDKKFRSAFEGAIQNRQEQSLSWRLHTLTWAAKHCLNVEGDFVECGVYKGFSFAVVAAYLDFEQVNKKIYLYDTYSGIPDEYNSEKRSNQVYEKETESDSDAIYNQALDRFKQYPNVELVRGIVPDSFEQAVPERISLLHIDMNSAKSELAALDVLFDRVTTGGMIIFDDYGWTGYVKQKIAEDDYMSQRNHSILELPTGQGLVVKL